MTDVRVSESMAAPAAKVWELLGDFGGVAKWGGSMLQSCNVEGEGVGAVRRIGLAGGRRSRNAAKPTTRRSARSRIRSSARAPFRSRTTCRSAASSRPARNECRVDWTGRFEPDGVSAEQAQGMVRGIYTGGIAGVRKLLGV